MGRRLCCDFTMERSELFRENRTLAPLARTICRVVELEWRSVTDQYFPRANFRHGQLQESWRLGLPHQQRMAKRGNARFTIMITENFAKTFTTNTPTGL